MTFNWIQKIASAIGFNKITGHKTFVSKEGFAVDAFNEAHGVVLDLMEKFHNLDIVSASQAFMFPKTVRFERDKMILKNAPNLAKAKPKNKKNRKVNEQRRGVR